jgi:hypothetical protein
MTNKQSTVLNMSLLPLGILIVLILGVGYFLLKGEIKLPKFNQGPQIRRLEGFPTTVSTIKEMEKQRKVLKSEAELDQFLNEIDPNGTLIVKSNITWDKEFVIAVTTSLNPESGHRIKIRKVYENKPDKSLQVSLDETEKGQYCEVDNEKNIAVDLAVISKTTWDINFDRTKTIEECENLNPKGTDSAPAVGNTTN